MRSPDPDGLTQLYPLPSPLAPLDAVRGTILALDWRVLRELGLFDDYRAALEPKDRAAVLAATVGSWVPLDLALVHYGALDALRLDSERIERVGWAVGNGVHGAFLLTLIRLAGSLGVSPWAALQQSYKLWVRSWRGGGIAVQRVAPQVAQVSLLGTGVCCSRFFCISFAGALCAGIAPFCKSPSASEVPGTRSAQSVAYKVCWS